MGLNCIQVVENKILEAMSQNDSMTHVRFLIHRSVLQANNEQCKKPTYLHFKRLLTFF